MRTLLSNQLIMRKIYPILLICLMAIMSSCNLKTYEGEITTEKHAIADYSQLRIDGPFNVSIDPNKDSGLTIIAPSDAHADIETRVEGSTLVLDLKSSGFMNPKIEVVLANDELDQIVIDGSGSFLGDLNPRDDLRLIIGGSGNIQTTADVKKLNVSISGSGNISANGRCDKLRASVSGSGNISLGKMEARDADLEISGSGSMRVNVSKNLVALVSGSGSIQYTGDPEEIDKTVSGSGGVSSF